MFIYIFYFSFEVGFCDPNYNSDGPNDEGLLCFDCYHQIRKEDSESDSDPTSEDEYRTSSDDDDLLTRYNRDMLSGDD